MKRHRAGLVALLGALVLAALSEPAAAAQISNSETQELIWDLNLNLLYVAIPITVLVEGILIYTVWRFSKNDEPLPTMENRRLEITWTVATAIILLFVGVASYQVLAEPMVTAQSTQQADIQEEPVEVEVVAQKYYWTFNYEDTPANTSQAYSEDNELSTQNTLVIPADRVVRLNITSKDWLHAVHVPALGLKQDAMPGQHNVIQTRVTEPGTYQLYCAEYCGSGHSQMLGTVRVLPEDEYESWVDEQQSS